MSALYRFALTLCRDPAAAEDLTQEAIYRALRSSSAPTPPAATKAWLFKILRNLWRDELRSARNTRQENVGEGDLDQFAAADSREAEAVAIAAEQRELILERMGRLPARQREVLHLRTVEELSIDEIAEVLESSRDAVKANLSIARRTMRDWLATATTPTAGRNEP